MSTISATAVVANLAISCVPKKKQDKSLTNEVHTSHRMADDAGSYDKFLYPKESVAAIARIMSAARADLKRSTLPSPFGQLLPAVRIDALELQMRTWEQAYNEEVEVFVRTGPSIIELVANKLTSAAFDPADYDLSANPHSGPAVHCHGATYYLSVAKLREHFGFTYRIHPLPSPDAIDGIAGLADSRVDQLRQQLRDSTREATTAARTEVIRRMLDQLDKVGRMLSNPDGPVFSRTLEKLEEMLTLAPAMNITGDATITRLTTDIRAHLTLAADALKDSSTVRNRTATAAKTILQGYGRRIDPAPSAAPAPTAKAA